MQALNLAPLNPQAASPQFKAAERHTMACPASATRPSINGASAAFSKIPPGTLRAYMTRPVRFGATEAIDLILQELPRKIQRAKDWKYQEKEDGIRIECTIDGIQYSYAYTSPSPNYKNPWDTQPGDRQALTLSQDDMHFTYDLNERAGYHLYKTLFKAVEPALIAHWGLGPELDTTPLLMYLTEHLLEAVDSGRTTSKDTDPLQSWGEKKYRPEGLPNWKKRPNAQWMGGGKIAGIGKTSGITEVMIIQDTALHKMPTETYFFLNNQCFRINTHQERLALFYLNQIRHARLWEQTINRASLSQLQADKFMEYHLNLISQRASVRDALQQYKGNGTLPPFPNPTSQG